MVLRFLLERAVRDKSMAAVEAKAHFADSLHSAERGEAVVITHHSSPVAAGVDAADLPILKTLRASPQAGLADVAGGWEGSAELAELWANPPRHRRRRSVNLDRS